MSTVARAQPPERELAELREYLGDEFEPRHLEDRKGLMATELEQIGDEHRLYRTSRGYLYDLTGFAMSGHKHPYLDRLTDAVPPPAKLLDYGCGIGSDGLALLELGYDVAFADFDNPSTRYLRWRLHQRGHREARIYDLDREDPDTNFDVAFSFDVVEHVDDPFAFLERMERAARKVMVNLLEPMDDGVPLHTRDVPVDELLDHLRSARRVRLHERLYDRSHLVLYDAKAIA
jgi:SAM-dependent methyltransferase